MSNTRLRLCIVDPTPQDYLALADAAHQHHIQVKFIETARAALRIVPAERIDVWMIYVQLPEISGFDLHDMLAERFPWALLVLVDEQHSDERERIARTGGVKLYLCKPPQTWWLDLLAHPPPMAGVAQSGW